MKYDVCILGSGLGGLECAYILSKNGMRACVVEKNAVLGGCLQSFKRKEQTFDTGFHYVGGLSEGEPLNKLFNYFGLMNLPWVKMDSLFDEIIINNKSYYSAQGHENFIKCLANEFPHQKENLKRYIDVLKNVGDNIFDSFNPNTLGLIENPLFTRSAKEFLEETITDPLLREILTGGCLKMELHENLPLYTFAQINNSFIQSAWRLNGDGSLIVNSLADSIKKCGSEIRRNAEVTELIEENGKISKIIINYEETIEADWIISNIHPSVTISLIKNSETIRKIYRKRMDSLENSFGMFTANIKLKPNSIPHLNRNQYIYKNANQWEYTEGTTDRILVNYYGVNDNKFADRIDLITPMTWNEVKNWADKPIGKRGEDYVQMKQKKTEECIKLASSVIENLEEAIDTIYTSTPLSYYTYTNSMQGSAYGVRKDCKNAMQTVLSARTPLSNLLMTGQNLNLHGILGVSMTSCITCAEILGMNKILEELGLNN